MSNLGRSLSQYWTKIQDTLFPQLEEELDPLTSKQQQLVTILELVRVEQFEIATLQFYRYSSLHCRFHSII